MKITGADIKKYIAEMIGTMVLGAFTYWCEWPKEWINGKLDER